MNITIVGLGYVGMSNAILLAQYNKVIAYDIDINKVNKINNKISPVNDELSQYYLTNKHLNITAVSDRHKAYVSDTDLVIICLPTDYDENIQGLNTVIIENEINYIRKLYPNLTILVKSTVPIGFCERFNVIFSPEFLREGHSLEDSLYPTRIIIGYDNEAYNDAITKYINIITKCILKTDTPIQIMKSKESESVKLFSNTYLAMRIAYFNEIDTFCKINNIDTKNVIDGVCMDNRIGNYYNNPSFGYGGYCLPKDSKQLQSQFKDIPADIINCINNSNQHRKEFIAKDIISKLTDKDALGIYRVNMKANSDNYRQSAILDIIDYIKANSNINIIIYEPIITDKYFIGCSVNNNLEDFINNSDLILANRISTEIIDYKYKTISSDIFGVN